MSLRSQFVVYVLLSILDFLATSFLVHNGFATEANPFIRAFAGLFNTFWVGLLFYKLGCVTAVGVLLKAVHARDRRASAALLVFANSVMFILAGWHLMALHLSARGVVPLS
jgi:hypothetical protein